MININIKGTTIQQLDFKNLFLKPLDISIVIPTLLPPAPSQLREFCPQSIDSAIAQNASTF